MTKTEAQLEKLDGIVAMLKAQIDIGLHTGQECPDGLTQQLRAGLRCVVSLPAISNRVGSIYPRLATLRNQG